jgi:nitrogen fixation/metabolism regulation signal transduction histidine kinase
MIILLAVLVAIMISRYIARPLQLIRNQLGAFSLGESNPRIEWHRTDEIGQLVSAYNQMIDELAVSAELLARSERESAWREMARQVAHEIKNPLTPIKLSMQHLIKAWDDKAPDWESRLKKFSQTLIFQIDTLSAIASEFSDFAQMPRPNLQRIDLISVITNSVQIFKDHENLTIQYPAQFGVYYVYADENQMLRVFNNLIKNSIQAIPQDQHGKIIINLENRQENCLLTFTDNGAGIPVEQQSRIFTPNFTTKSAGMGLGLAMVKNIIDNTGGRIWFESSAGSGTTFHLLIPVTLK